MKNLLDMWPESFSVNGVDVMEKSSTVLSVQHFF